MDISVIIPIYNVEEFIHKCALSLLDQTKDEVELIFVNDCSTDDSMLVLNKVLNQYIHTPKNVRIINHETNKGLPSARNSGLNIASGKYIFHCDGDDFLEVNALELLYKKAIEENSDIVYSDWYLSYQNSERYMSQDRLTEISSQKYLEAILEGTLKYNVWNKLVVRDLYVNNNIRFPDGQSMGEDMTMIKLIAHAKSVAYLPIATYHYLKINSNAMTNTLLTDVKLKQMLYNVEDVMTYVLDNKGDFIIDKIHFFKLNVKFPFLISEDVSSYELWNELFKESNPYIGKNVNESKRNVFLQQAALKKRYAILKIYNIFIMKYLYNFLYK